MATELRPPSAVEEWDAYHAIRRRVLFERRGVGHLYDPDHPDDRRDGNHPLVLVDDDRVVGVVRIDVAGTVAILRRVAIDESAQGCGYGRELLKQANDFARKHGCTEVQSFVAPDAVDFYARSGFSRVGSTSAAESVPMARAVDQG
ncbi:MAG: GNAT family N-acetyltransferase [Cytophagaceae bacterium]|nr:GNAT family N-acetyltransferase [Gemmatimonadaceae bacterium]